MKYSCKYLVLALMLNGCAERTTGSLLSSLNNRYEYEAIKAENGPLYKAISLTGLLPTQKLGAPYYFNSQEGMDASFEVGGEKTLYMSQAIGDTITMADVQDVSQKIIEVKRMSNRALHAKLNLIKAQKDKDAPSTSKYMDAYQMAKKELDVAHRSAVAALKPGIIILQWGNSNKDQDNFTLSESGFRYSYNDKFKGLLVLGGIKISKLSSLGKDFCPRIAAIEKNKVFCSLKQDIVIPTYILQTRHLVFMDQLNDLEKDSVIIALDKAVESNDLSILDKIELESIHQQAYSLFGAGELSGLKTTFEPGYRGFHENNQWIPVYAILPSAQNLSSKLKKWCS